MTRCEDPFRRFVYLWILFQVDGIVRASVLLPLDDSLLRYCLAKDCYNRGETACGDLWWICTSEESSILMYDILFQLSYS